MNRAGGGWRTLVLAGATAALAYGAARLMFSAFMFYDDEGYVLMSLKNFAEHGGLYRDVYSQYGPFPFVLYYVLHVFGLPFTHIAERLLTLGMWIVVAVSCASVVRFATRSLALALAVLAGTFPYLWIMVSEPSHPGGLIAAIVAASGALGYRWLAQNRVTRWAAVTGAAAALVALTKINVGGFIVLSGVAWILLHHKSDVVRRRAPFVLAVGALVVPFVLMRPMLEMRWVQILALVFSCSALASVLASRGEPGIRATWRSFGWCVASGLIATAVILGVLFARGTSAADLFEGVILGPLRHSKAFNLGYTWPAGAAATAVGSLLLCGAAIVLRKRGVVWIQPIIAGLRLVAAAGAIAAVLRFPVASPDRIVFGYGAPCIWLFLWRLPGENGAAKPALTWLGLLWLGQYLHTFPVAGSQIAWGTFLALPLAAIGAHQAVTSLAERFGDAVSRRRRTIFLSLQTALAGFAVWIGVHFVQAGERYREGSDLGLPGAEILRLPTSASALFRVLAMNSAAHGDMLFSEPGMFSLNFWSGLPTPTRTNVTHWFSLISSARQQAIIRALEAHPRACIIIQREHIEYLTRRSFAPAGELHDYIAKNFSPAFKLDNFDFCVRNQRRIDPVLLGEMRIGSDTPRQPNTTLRVRLPLPRQATIARIEVSSAQSPTDAPLVFDASNAKVEVEGPSPAMVSWPLRLEGAPTLLIHFDRFSLPRPTAGSVIMFRAADGNEVALARLKE